MNPALTPSPPSTASKYCAVDDHDQGTPVRSDSSGMPSTRASMRIRYSLSDGFPDSGAMENPQLPASPVDDLSAPDNHVEQAGLH
jgi:hypothetical protein